MRRAVLFEPQIEKLNETKKNIVASNFIQLIAQTSDFDQLMVSVRREDPDIVFLSTETMNGEGPKAISKVRQYNENCVIVALGATEDMQSVLQCFRSGANEYLVKPIKVEELHALLERVVKYYKYSKKSTFPKGKVVGIMGCRGGCGTSTIASNIAYHVQSFASTMLVDFHFEQGDLSFYFNQRSTNTIKELLESHNRMDEVLVDNVTTRYTNDLSLIFQPLKEKIADVKSDDIEKLLLILRKKYQFIFLDLGHQDTYTPHIIPHIDEVILVMNQTIPSMYMSTQKLMVLKKNCFDRNAIKVIVNAYRRYHSISVAKIEKVLGVKDQVYCIREDSYYVELAMNRGMPLFEVKARSKSCKDIVQFAKSAYKKDISVLRMDQNRKLIPYFGENRETQEKSNTVIEG